MPVSELSPEEVRRHFNLIRVCFREFFGEQDVDIELHGNGVEKGVYRVEFNNQKVLAAAAARDETRLLLEEYNILTHLYRGAARFFPAPKGHYVPQNGTLGEVLLMEFLPHLDIDRFLQESPRVENFYRKLAYQLGKAVAAVNIKTGRYSSEPHNGNILVRSKKDNVEIKFCDAIQFKTGSLEDATEIILTQNGMRPESFRFIKKFRQGLAESMSTLQGISYDDAYSRLDFLKQYNDIF